MDGGSTQSRTLAQDRVGDPHLVDCPFAAGDRAQLLVVQLGFNGSFSSPQNAWRDSDCRARIVGCREIPDIAFPRPCWTLAILVVDVVVQLRWRPLDCSEGLVGSPGPCSSQNKLMAGVNGGETAVLGDVNRTAC
jgi:hypothetical protein